MLVIVLKAKWIPSVLGSLVNRKGSKQSSLLKKKKKRHVLGHRKLRESQDVLSNGYLASFHGTTSMKAKRKTLKLSTDTPVACNLLSPKQNTENSHL